MANIKDRIFCGLQYLLPQHLLSRLAARLAEAKVPWLTKLLIGLFIRRYQVDVSEARHQDLSAYASFNEFFTRALRLDVRSVEDDAKAVISPADGIVSQCGNIDGGNLLQAKGHTYQVEDLIGDEAIAKQFQTGKFITTYLSPRDYHRVHMPIAGTLIQSIYIPGKLFSVNEVTAMQVSRLFARNERLVCLFESQHGPFILVMVGAMMVAGIETVWQDNYPPGKPNRHNHKSNELQFEKGSEIGRFKFGSTVILLVPDQFALEDNLKPGQAVQMGETVAALIK